MKKLLLFIAGISILFLAGCYNGNQSHGNEGMGDSLPADPPLGYVIELKLCFFIICLKIMKKLLLFIAGISILFLAGCYNGNQSHGNEGMGDSLPADPPLGYVIELKPLGNFSHQEATAFLLILHWVMS